MFKEQLQKEKTATKKVFRWYVKYLIGLWGLIGLCLLLTPGFPLGLVFIFGSIYIYNRISKK